MRISWMARLLAGAVMVCPTAEAVAQEASDPKAIPADSEAESFGDIVVTARKRSENLQDVPIAISALSNDSLKSATIRTTEDIGRIVPGVTITNQSGAVTPFIRGIGAISGNPGFEAAVATYVDGVYIGSNYGSKVSVVDVDRVEVLKGPQGTLFGRNSVGGLINIVTREPSFDFTGNARFSYSRFDTLESDVFVTGGLTDTIAMSLSGSYFNRNKGFGTHIFSGADTYTGEDQNFRLKLLFRPSEATKITLSGDYRKLDSLEGVSMNLFPGFLSIDGQTGPAPGFYDGLGDPEGSLRVTSKGAWARIEQEFGNFDVKSLTSYRRETNYHRRDLDLSQSILADFSWSPTYRTFSQELQFNSKPDSAIKWVAGLFYLHDKTGYDRGEFRVFGPVIGGNFAYRNVLKTDSYAIFAETTVPLGERTNVTVGGRYTIDKRRISGSLAVYGNVGDRVDDPVTAPVLIIPTVPNKATYKTPTWRFIVDHEIAPNNMLFASYSRGFKAGNINMLNPANVYNPEKLDAFEVGYKGEVSDFLRFSVGGFYYKYRDQQVTFFSGTEITSNAGRSNISGGELEYTIVPTKNFQIRGAFAYLDATFDKYKGAICVDPLPTGGQSQRVCDVSGRRMTRAPKFTATISPSFTIPSSVGEFQLSATYSHSSKYFADVENDLSQKALDLISARVAWESDSSPITVALFGQNLSDVKYWAFANPATFGYYYSAAAPRTYGVEIGVKF